MKSRIFLVLFICGFAALLGVAVYLTRSLYKTPDRPAKSKPGVQAPASPETSLTDAVVEVGRTPSQKAVEGEGQSNMLRKSAAGESFLSMPVGKVVYLSGTATATDQLGKTRVLAPDSEIFQRERIETTPGTKMDIRFTDGTQISQGEKSVIVIDEYLFDPRSAERCSFVGRFTKGICRVVTGLITDINPDRFKVRTKMATVGIRGCDLVFKSNSSKDDIYVLELGRAKSVQIQTTSDGTPVMDPATGRILPVEKFKAVELTVTEPQTAVTITDCKGYEERKISVEESRTLITESSHLAPARYELQQKADGATLRIAPSSSQEGNTQEK